MKRQQDELSSSFYNKRCSRSVLADGFGGAPTTGLRRASKNEAQNSIAGIWRVDNGHQSFSKYTDIFKRRMEHSAGQRHPDRESSLPDPQTMRPLEPIDVFCVYGEKHVQHLEQILIPALSAAAEAPIRLWCMNYDGGSSTRVTCTMFDQVSVVDIRNPRARRCGFAESHNEIFRVSGPDHFFIIMNPDTIPQASSIDLLIARYRRSFRRVAIVEGRQWPFEHPKEFDPLTLETPWASGAFCLIDAGFYREIHGMDELYFLYMEDVDLSWQAWLNGYTVLYEPASVIAHFSGGRYYRADVPSREQRYSLRNFLILAKKFFGDPGEFKALRQLDAIEDKALARRVVTEYSNHYQSRINDRYVGQNHPRVKILGLNCFHETK